MTQDKLKELEKIFDGNLDLMLFYVTWIKNGLNASKAYKELHPNVTDHSSRVLGSITLARISKTAIMQAYGLDQTTYFNQLSEGIKADRSDMTGQILPDHKTRQDYLHTLGKLLGIEKEKPSINISGDKVIAILGGMSVSNNNSNKETPETE